MKQAVRLYVGALLVVFTFGVSGFALAQDKGKDAKAVPVAKAEKGKAVTKVLHNDDRVRVTETTYKPGDVSPSVVRGLRVTRTLSGGKMQRTYADGKTDTFARKAGEVTVQGPDKDAYSLKNIGKSDFVIFTVTIKGAKK
jgi:hypothetical protein